MSEKGGEVSIEPGSSVRPNIDKQSEQIESLESQRARSANRLKGLKALATGGLIALAAKGGVSTFNESANAISTSQDNRPAVTESGETERLKRENEVYGLYIQKLTEGTEGGKREETELENIVEEKYGIRSEEHTSELQSHVN